MSDDVSEVRKYNQCTPTKHKALLFYKNRNKIMEQPEFRNNYLHKRTLQRNYRKLIKNDENCYITGRKDNPGGRPKRVSQDALEEATNLIDMGELENGEDVRCTLMPDVPARTVRQTLSRDAGYQGFAQKKKPDLLPQHISQREAMWNRYREWEDLANPFYVIIRSENFLCGSRERRRREIDGTFLFWGVASDFAATILPHLTQHVTKRGKADHSNEQVERPEVVRPIHGPEMLEVLETGYWSWKTETRSGSQKLNTGTGRRRQEGREGNGMTSMDKMEPRIIQQARCSWERSGPKDTDGTDNQTDCAHTLGRQPDRLCKAIEQMEVDQMGRVDNRRMVQMNWSQGLSDGLEACEKAPDPRAVKQMKVRREQQKQGVS
ncbi:hypothetical protein DFH08DRAFT_812417 [Mycena albidolilacea]|uniref:Uncharacterized protein n=1 Tax=Mycena albidolilacea TaxID=1033008 RepID=A0AAD7ELX6_9AGAR|nr:hypothetical protein DFH08DRAFT_812417 [Mycena albidolilacea]